MAWVVATTPRSHFPVGLAFFSLCSCREEVERREKEKQAGRVEDPAMDAKALGDRDTKSPLFLGLMGMWYPVSWNRGRSTALEEIKTCREAEEMQVKVMLATLLSSYPSLILLIVHTQPEFRGLGSLVS